MLPLRPFFYGDVLIARGVFLAAMGLVHRTEPAAAFTCAEAAVTSHDSPPALSSWARLLTGEAQKVPCEADLGSRDGLLDIHASMYFGRGRGSTEIDMLTGLT